MGTAHLFIGIAVANNFVKMQDDKFVSKVIGRKRRSNSNYCVDKKRTRHDETLEDSPRNGEVILYLRLGF